MREGEVLSIPLGFDEGKERYFRIINSVVRNPVDLNLSYENAWRFLIELMI